ncbi:MAG: hypothetical protein AAF492_14150, partial [Verrucomicrobiota bacterium]
DREEVRQALDHAGTLPSKEHPRLAMAIAYARWKLLDEDHWVNALWKEHMKSESLGPKGRIELAYLAQDLRKSSSAFYDLLVEAEATARSGEDWRLCGEGWFDLAHDRLAADKCYDLFERKNRAVAERSALAQRFVDAGNQDLWADGETGADF